MESFDSPQEEMAKKAYPNKSKVRIFTDNIIGGIGWGMGSIIGAVMLVTILGFIAARVQAIPFIGEFVYGVIEEVKKLQGK